MQSVLFYCLRRVCIAEVTTLLKEKMKIHFASPWESKYIGLTGTATEASHLATNKSVALTVSTTTLLLTICFTAAICLHLIPK